MGRLDKQAVIDSIKTNIKYCLITLTGLSVILFLTSHQLAKLFFTKPEMQNLFARMLMIHTTYLVFNCIIPGLSTLLRIFDMNIHATMIVFVVFGIPFISQNYIYVVYCGLENFSPVISLGVCNILVVLMAVYFLFKYAPANFDRTIRRLTESKTKAELLNVIDTTQDSDY